MSDFDTRLIAYCAHCGNTAPQRLVHKQRYLERSWTAGSDKEDKHPWSTFVAICETCGHVLLYDNPGDIFDDEHFSFGGVCYPTAGQLHRAVPKTIREVYAEASRIREVAPNAFASQIRRALEALCEDRNAKGRTLHKMLEDLANRDEIPDGLSEITDVLRLIGNIGSHGISETVHPLQAYAIDDFFKVVVEYVYVAPAKLDEFKKRMESSKNVDTSGN